MIDEFTTKLAARKFRSNAPVQERIADTVDNIATALERAAQKMQQR